MWTEITNENDVVNFLDYIQFFHDSCLKELKYVSGAFVDEDMSMHPLNDQRILRVIFQQQRIESSMIEMEFSELQYLKLSPVDCQYTCEILDSTMVIDNGFVYWADTGGLSIEEMNDYDGTVICAAKLRWRLITGHFGRQDFYKTPE